MIIFERDGYTKEEIIDALHGKKYPRNIKFRYDLLNKDGAKKGVLSSVIYGEVSLSAFANIKRTARFLIKDEGEIDWLNDRIQPFVEVKMPRAKRKEKISYSKIQTTQKDLSEGALEKTNATANGDLILEKGADIKVIEESQQDFSSGTLNGVLATNTGLQLGQDEGGYFLNGTREMSLDLSQVKKVKSSSISWDSTEQGHLYFDGIDDRVEVSNANGAVSPTQQTTWEIIFKMNAWTQYDSLMGFGNNNWDIRMDNKQWFQCHTYDTKSSWIPITPSWGFDIDDGKWHRLSLVWDGVNGIRKAYMDGVQCYYATMPAGIMPRDMSGYSKFYIGAVGPSGRNANCWIDEVRIWNTARTQEEIQNSQIVTGNELGLNLCYKFDEYQGTVAQDSSGKGNSGAIVGASWDISGVTIETSLDNGATWIETEKNSSIPMITPGVNLQGKNLLIRQKLNTTDRTFTPQLSKMTIDIYSAYEMNGQRIGPALDLNGVGVVTSSKCHWNETLALNTSIKIQTSLDDGATWHDVVNGSQIPGVVKGTDLSGKNLLSRQILTTTDNSITPVLHDISFEINGEKTTIIHSGFIEFPLGVFLLSSPKRREQNGFIYREVEAYDGLLVLLDDKFLERYIVEAGTNYVYAVESLLQESGITKWKIEPTDKVLPADIEFEPGKERLFAINELLRAVNFTPIHVDVNGYYTAERYKSPAAKTAEHIYKDDELSVIYNGLEEELDLFHVPNKWVAVYSSPEREPLVSSYTNENPESLTSTINRGRAIVDYREISEVADQQSLDDYVKKIAFEASQIYGKLLFETAIMPIHDYMDVFNVEYAPLGIGGKYTETAWTIPLTIGGRMKHEVRKVVDV